MKRRSQTLLDTWNRYWFSAIDPRVLGICRIIFYAVLFYLTYEEDWRRVSRIPMELFDPLPWLKFIGFKIISAENIGVLQVAYKVAIVTSCLGLFSRVSTWVAFLSFAYLETMPGQFGGYTHAHPIIILTMGILAFSHCGDTLSLDSVIKKHFLKKPKIKRSSGLYSWPIKLVWWLWAYMFFAAGVCKLRNSGLHWFDANVIQDYTALDYFLNYFYLPMQFKAIHFFAKYELSRFGWMGLVLELAAPLVLVNVPLRLLILFSMICFQIVILLVVGPDFSIQSSLIVFFLPWENILKRIDRIKIWKFT
jgi:hypothetical protein